MSGRKDPEQEAVSLQHPVRGAQSGYGLRDGHQQVRAGRSWGVGSLVGHRAQGGCSEVPWGCSAWCLDPKGPVPSIRPHGDLCPFCFPKVTDHDGVTVLQEPLTAGVSSGPRAPRSVRGTLCALWLAVCRNARGGQLARGPGRAAMLAVRPDAQQPSRSSRRSVIDPVTPTSAVQQQEPRDALAAVPSRPGVWAPGSAPRGCQLGAALWLACGGILPRPWGVGSVCT